MNLDKILADIYLFSNELHLKQRDSEAVYYAEKHAVQSLNTLGLMYCSLNFKKYEESLSLFKKALEIDNGNWMLWSNISHVYSLQEKYEEALDASLKSIQYGKGYFQDPYYNAGVIYNALNMCKESEEMYRCALNFNPENHQINYNLSLAILRQRLCMEGWQKYESRFETSQLTGDFKKRFIQDHWDGRNIKNKSLVVYSEQGLGDFIFFSRFLPKIKKMVGNLIVEVQDCLIPVVGKNLKADEIVSRPSGIEWPEPPDSDYCVSICSLPLILKLENESDIPNSPYYFAPNKKRPDFFDEKKLNIGICWAGSPDHKRDSTRSTELENFRILSNISNVQLYGISKIHSYVRSWTSGVIDLNKGIENFPFIDLNEKINDFGDLAHYVNYLDCVITVDTALAHLAGAMGKKVFLLIGKESDWRWGNEEKTFWYPTMKIFRYKTNWKDLIKEVFEEIEGKNK